ncbi:MAG: hypothetical protein P1U46_02170 [Patescibacteria group bacterium]|nr:hypothetical protein [Patescibacteria group bacterium]
MKKIILFFFLFSLFSTNVSAYLPLTVSDFINSVNKDELSSIEDENLKKCEEIFLRAYMRREFTQEENDSCSDIFEQKIEAEMDYKRYVM